MDILYIYNPYVYTDSTNRRIFCEFDKSCSHVVGSYTFYYLGIF